MPGKTYRVRISRGDQQFEAEGDKAFVLSMVKRFDAAETADSIVVATKDSKGKPDVAVLASAKGISAGEFVRQLGVRKHTDLVVAFGFYLEQHKDAKAFTAADISTCYYEAKMEASNISQSIVQNIKRGYVMVAKGSKNVKGLKKSYTLTSSGESFVRGLGSKAKTK